MLLTTNKNHLIPDDYRNGMQHVPLILVLTFTVGIDDPVGRYVRSSIAYSDHGRGLG